MMTILDKFADIEEVKELLGREYQVSKLAGDASNRQYYRAVGGETSLILCYSPDSSTNEKFLNVAKIYAENKLPVPEVYASLDGGHLVLLEDLGNQSFLDSSQLLSNSSQQSVYNQLFAIAEKISLMNKVTFPVFDKPWIDRERAMLINGLKSAETASEQDLVEFNNDCIERNEKLLIEEKNFVPQHRDFHGRNIQVKGESYFIIDFQDTFLSNRYYDIVSLVYDPYAKLSLNTRQALIADYKLTQVHFDEGKFLATARQRLWKAIGTYLNQHFVHTKSNYIQYVRPACEILSYLELSKVQERMVKRLKDAEID